MVQFSNRVDFGNFQNFALRSFLQSGIYITKGLAHILWKFLEQMQSHYTIRPLT